jgi:UPF0755 protein
MTHRKKHIGVLSLVRFSLVVLALLAIFGIATWQYLLTPPKGSSDKTFTIPPGSSVLKIGQILYDNNLIRSPRVFQLYVRLNNISLQAGDYSLSPAKLPEIAQSLTKGKENEIRVTIPEGYRREQIAEVIESKLGIKQTDFLAASKGLEGTLFPDTYAFSKDATAQEVVKVMTDTFAKKTGSLNLTKNDIILASIVEREALTVAEKPVVAGILKNRLADGWALEVDATIQYIMGKSGDWWPVPLLGDRKRVSPYNTYLNRALPPAPIGNPGLVALEAVASPATNPYYFYLHDKSGVIHYATTNAEHEANIAKYIAK